MEAYPSGQSVPMRVSEWRLEYFRRQLYEITYRSFLKTKKEI